MLPRHCAICRACASHSESADSVRSCRSVSRATIQICSPTLRRPWSVTCATPGLANVTSSASLVQPEIVIQPMPERAAELGVSTEALSAATRIATGGDVSMNLPKFNLPERQVPIRVRLNDEARGDIERIRSMLVPGRAGLVPLENIANVSFGAGPTSIERYDRSRNVTISADLGGAPLGDVLKKVEQMPALAHLPEGVERRETGDVQRMRELFGGFFAAMAIGLLCIYAVLVLLFHDFIQPLTILGALPQAVGGALAALLLFGYGLSLPSLIGLLMLMGIVTKNSILLVEYVVMARTVHGMSRMDALIDACAKRARPIIMTTIAMIAGMFPVAAGWSGGSELPLAHGYRRDRRAHHLDGAEPVRRAHGLHGAGRLPEWLRESRRRRGSRTGAGALLRRTESWRIRQPMAPTASATRISNPNRMRGCRNEYAWEQVATSCTPRHSLLREGEAKPRRRGLPVSTNRLKRVDLFLQHAVHAPERARKALVFRVSAHRRRSDQSWRPACHRARKRLKVSMTLDAPISCSGPRGARQPHDLPFVRVFEGGVPNEPTPGQGLAEATSRFVREGSCWQALPV